MATALVIATAAAGVGWALFFIALVGGNDQLAEVTAERDALLVVTDEQEADLATYRRNAIRPVGETPVFDLLAARKKAFDRDLDRANQLTHYRPEDWNNWGTDNGDAS